MPSKTVNEILNEEPKMDMTPMIDIVFQLIVFFMIAMKFRLKEGRLDSVLPKDMGQNAGGKPIDRDMTRLRIVLLKVEPKKLMTMVKQYKRFDEVFGKNERLGETEWRMQFQVQNQPVMDLVQKTIMTGVGEVKKQPETTFRFYQQGREVKNAGDVLYQRLLAEYRKNPKLPVIIDPDRAATYAALIMGLNACRKVGFEEIRFSGKISPITGS